MKNLSLSAYVCIFLTAFVATKCAMAEQLPVTASTSELWSSNTNEILGLLGPQSLYMANGSIVLAGSTEHPADGRAVTIYPNGSVVFGPEFSGNKPTAREFWRAIAKTWPGMVIDRHAPNKTKAPVPPPKTWHLLTVSNKGTVSIVKDLTKDECDKAYEKLYGYMLHFSNSSAGTWMHPSDFNTAECFE